MVQAYDSREAVSSILPPNSLFGFSGGSGWIKAILNYLCKSAGVSAIQQPLASFNAGLSAPLRGDFSPYSDRPVNLALIQPLPLYIYTCLP